MINKEILSLQTNRIIKGAALLGAFIALAGGYTWYLDNFWKPKVIVKSVDYDNGIAQLNLNGTDVTLLGDAPFSAKGNWAVKFGTNRQGNAFIYDRLELTKFGNVVEYIVEKNKL